MKNLICCTLTLTGALFMTQAHSATYAGQNCEGRDGATLRYSTTGATNTTANTVNITCPVVHLKDGGTAGVDSVIYFVNDGKSKSCFFDNFNIDTGGLWGWTTASGVSRVVLPRLSATKAWSPYTFNCTLPSNSKVTGYYINEL
jgi:hypothetical protein